VIGGVLRILVIGLVALVAAIMMLRPDTPTTALVIDEPRPLPDVALTDHNGNAFSLSDLNGRNTLVFFGFTNCPDICPLTLAVIAEASAKLRQEAPRVAPNVLFVSVDPARDSAERIRTYLSAFDDDFIGVTADEQTLKPLIDTLGVTVHKQTDGGETYNVIHNGTIFVLDNAGRWFAVFGGSAHRAEIIASDFLAIRRRS